MSYNSGECWLDEYGPCVPVNLDDCTTYGGQNKDNICYQNPWTFKYAKNCWACAIGEGPGCSFEYMYSYNDCDTSDRCEGSDTGGSGYAGNGHVVPGICDAGRYNGSNPNSACVSGGHYKQCCSSGGYSPATACSNGVCPDGQITSAGTTSCNSPPSCNYVRTYNQCGAGAGACANHPDAIAGDHTVEVQQYECRYDCNDLGVRAGECGNPNKYKCSGSSCVQDNTNGTYTDSNCGGNCNPSNYCTAAGYYACTPGTSGSCILNGQTCTDYDVYKCNFNGQNYCSKSTCGTPCAPGTTPKYRCSGSSCIRDDAGGTYTSSNCNNDCAGTGTRTKTYVSPATAKVGETVTITSTADWGCETYINQQVGGGVNSCSGSGYRCDGNPIGDGKPCWWRETCRAANTGNFTASFNAGGSNCYSSQSYTINPNYTYSWKTGNWGGCSNNCGTGTQTRSVWCERSDGTTVADSNCGGAKPAASQACTDYSSCTYSWQAGSWGACSVSCGGGTRIRDVWCRRDQTGERVADSNCGGGKPNANEPCNQFPCVPTGLTGSCPVPGTSATLNWNAAAGATYYEVTVNGQTTRTNSSGPLTINNMIAGQNNEWRVRGCSTSVCGGTAIGSVYCTAVSRNAQFISRTCPPSFMVPGQTANVQVVMKNTGNYRWSPTEMYRLGSQNPVDNTTWGLGRVNLGSDVAVGSQYAFNFTVTAPNTQGRQNFQWQMLQENVAWFGDMSANCTDVTVSPPCPTGRGACGDYVPSPWTIGDCSGGTWVASHGTDNGYDKWCQNYVNPTRGYCYRCDRSFSPWIQAVGDVHSNERINASGGP